MSTSITTTRQAPSAPASLSRAQAPSRAASLLRIGFWSAVAMTAFYTAWDLGFVASFFLKWPTNLIAQWAPSAFIPATWVVLMVSVNRWAEEDKRVFSEVAIAFGVAYAVLSTSVYFLQLAVAIPKEMAGGQVGMLLWEQPRSFPYATDILGYTFMSLSALFAAFVFGRERLEKWIRWTLVVAGLPAFVLPIQLFWLPAEIGASPTLLAFPAAGVLLAILFRRGMTEA